MDIYDKSSTGIIFGTEEIKTETAMEKAFREAQEKKAKKDKEKEEKK